MSNLSLIGLRNKNVTKKPHFRWNKRAEIRNDVTNFCCFEKLLAYALFLPSFIVVRHQMAELNWGGGAFCRIGLTLFDMGGMMPPKKMFLTMVLKRLGGGS